MLRVFKFMSKTASINAVLLILMFSVGCQFFSSRKNERSTAKQDFRRGLAQDYSHYHDPKHVITYNNLMSNPLYKTNSSNESEEFFLPHLREMVERQFDSIYIGQFLLHDFDAELNELLKVKATGKVLGDDDFQKLNLIYFKLKVAWIVSDRNKGELADLYLLTLEDRVRLERSPDPERLIRVRLVLSQIPGWLDEATQKGYGLAVLPLAQELDAINRDFLRRTPEGKDFVINFERYLKISNPERARQFQLSRNPDIRKKFNRLSRFVDKTAQKQFEELFNEYENKPEEMGEPLVQISDRTPNTATNTKPLDELYPSPGGTGHMTGNRVPANNWALTFDDGPHATHTEGMYRVLSQNQVSGTFFWLSRNMKIYEPLVKQAEKLGFPRGSHSMTHANLPKLGSSALDVEITQAASVFESIVGKRPTLFRCPYGACGPMNSPIRQLIAKNDMLHVAWNVDTLDWQDKNPQSIFERTKKQIELRGKGIVLFHDIHQQSVDALRMLVPWMKSKGYKIVSLVDMISETRGKPYASP